MSIDTTVNIHSTVLSEINREAEKSGLPRNKIINMLLKKAMNDSELKIQLGSRIKYQERDELKEWHRKHVYFAPNDYEYFLDIRKIYKMSLSHILAYAVKKYLTTLNAPTKTDNYLFDDYKIVLCLREDAIFWNFYWVFPDG